MFCVNKGTESEVGKVPSLDCTCSRSAGGQKGKAIFNILETIRILTSKTAGILKIDTRGRPSGGGKNSHWAARLFAVISNNKESWDTDVF